MIGSPGALISICIPAYNRPDFLRAALESCAAQTYAPIEIVIGDDSSDDAPGAVVAEFQTRFAGTIRYQRNRPALRQNANVSDLFRRATGERLMLLHDDDTLLPAAVQQLAACWDAQPGVDAAFGKQLLMDNAGAELPGSDALNARFHRTAANAGRLAVPAVAGLLRMFPNDGYLVRTELARAIDYRPFADVGNACDTDFGVRLCLAAENVYFVDDFVLNYRISADAITGKGALLEMSAYTMISSAAVPSAAAGAQREALTDLAPGATSGFARSNQPQRALAVYLSHHYPLQKRLQPRGLYHAWLVATAFARALVRPR